MKQLYTFILVLLLVSCGVSRSVHHLPQTTGYHEEIPSVQKHTATAFSYKNNFLVQNPQKLWELYAEGDPLERGMIIGSLSDSLIKYQEKVFFGKIGELVPSKFRQRLLRHFLKYYNRNLYKNVLEEYQTEIYGLSLYTSNDFDYLGPKYLRTLYLHGAHDIGHALTDLSLVGCTSFAVWNEKSADGTLLIGRNLDFYAGDDFATNKVVYFIRPDQGYPYMSVSWPGMLGVVSGMNLEGLTVTINAGKSSIPLAAKTPISLVAREIVQYARTIEEAIAIAKKRKVFVSESIMVGSAADHKAVLIEVSPSHFGVYEVANKPELVCANHFQSMEYQDDTKNLKHIRDSHSQYRFDRMTELLNVHQRINPEQAAGILRNTNGIQDGLLGYGNEKALNQLLAHHGIIFQPELKRVWVSANPYQLGTFVCYDLNTVFNTQKHEGLPISLATTHLNIAPDPFLETKAYANYEAFRIQNRIFDAALRSDNTVTDIFIAEYQSLNPEYWGVYEKAGRYYLRHKEKAKAKVNFEKALTKEITTLPERKAIEKILKHKF